MPTNAKSRIPGLGPNLPYNSSEPSSGDSFSGLVLSGLIRLLMGLEEIRLNSMYTSVLQYPGAYLICGGLAPEISLASMPGSLEEALAEEPPIGFCTGDPP